ncbi:MAG: D-alanine--D-alanine ligase, partial [bacterium]|nr:D-alanine--D-alanine ligase [bacterium]
VLGGGPDAEREVSLVSSKSVADALATRAGVQVTYKVIDRLSTSELSQLAGDVVFPVLHGPWGEGGPLQDVLEADGRPFVGCRSAAARIAMDKMASKLAASLSGIPTKPAAVFSPRDGGCPLPFPVVIKPVHEGSSVGVHFATDVASWETARLATIEDLKANPSRVYMVEEAVVGGRELTVGVLDGKPLDPVEICPAVKFYDYHAKYHSDDTRYVVDPELPTGVKGRVQEAAVTLFRAIGCRHLSRVDFLLDSAGQPWLLEINTMPGFTGHSLLPMAANASGLPFAALCARLVECAGRDGRLR